MARAARLLDGTSALRCLVFEGAAGIGKSTVWQRALEVAEERGYRVLSCRPAGSEVQLAFAALGDLAAPVPEEVLQTLARPRREALEVALLRREGGAPGARAVGVALLEVLQRLARHAPLLVAVDDLQWLDAPSAHALQFALRRLGPEPVAVVATERVEGGAPRRWLEETLGAERVERVRIGPFSVGATNELLRSRLGVQFRRGTLLRIHEASGGNAFVALELARELERRGGDIAPGEPLPLPTGVEDLVGERLGQLPQRTRRLLLAAGALTRPTVEQLVRLDGGGARALRLAEQAGVIEVSDGIVRFTHPFLALLPYHELTAVARRRLHARLAAVAASAEERARHAALSVDGPNAAVAAALDAAAAEAGARGAAEAAAELSALAAQRTPPTDHERRCERLLSAAEWHQRAGELDSAIARAEDALASAQALGPARARAYALLGSVRCDTESVAAGIELYERALREPAGPARLRAEVHQKLAWILFAAGETQSARRHARAAVRLAGDDAAIAASATATAAQVEVARTGRAPRRLLDRALALERSARAARPSIWIETEPSILEGVVLLWAGELEQATEPLQRMHATARASDDPWLLMHSLAYLSSLETGLGRPRAGLDLAARYLALATESGLDAQRAGALWPYAAAAAWLGRADDVRSAAVEAAGIAEQTGHRLFLIGGLAARGALDLSLGRTETAAAALERAYVLARESGIVPLGRFGLGPVAVEALAELGRLERAEALAREVTAQAETIRRPWALALARRCAGMLAGAREDHETMEREFRRALAEHARQPRPLEEARTRLAFGGALRRAGRKRDARSTLEAARDAFESAGAAAWAARTQDELRRIGGRQAAAGGQLSATEAQIAELVASGRSNAETAATLRLSPRTVEWNLSKIYRKLAVRSRSELAATLNTGRG